MITLALFIIALFEKGLTHDLLLEAGVFLVSVKLVMAAYTGSVRTERLLNRLNDLEQGILRLEGLVLQLTKPQRQ